MSLAALLAITAVPAAAQGTRASGSTYRDCEDCPEMVVVPAGSFVMGQPGSHPVPGVAAA